MHRHTRFAALACIITALPLQAAVIFNFQFDDADTGRGFDDPALGQARRDALYSVANDVIGQSLAYDNTSVDIRVGQSASINDHALASGGSYGPTFSQPGFNHGRVTRAIQMGLNFTNDPEGYIAFDFDNYNYHLGIDAPPDDAYDFRSIALHELTHTLGFTSWIAPDGTSRYLPDIYASFDQFLTDNHGRKLVDQHGQYQFDPDNPPDAVYFVGPNTLVANQGRAYRIATGSHHPTDSQIGHLLIDDAVMNSHIATGEMRRQWTTADKAILLDLGYDILGQSTIGEAAPQYLALEVDLQTLDQNWNRSDNVTILDGDLNEDGIVGLLDLDLFGKRYTYTPQNLIPEPTTFTLLLTATAILTRRKSHQ